MRPWHSLPEVAWQERKWRTSSRCPCHVLCCCLAASHGHFPGAGLVWVMAVLGTAGNRKPMSWRSACISWQVSLLPHRVSSPKHCNGTFSVSSFGTSSLVGTCQQDPVQQFCCSGQLSKIRLFHLNLAALVWEHVHFLPLRCHTFLKEWSFWHVSWLSSKAVNIQQDVPTSYK